MEGLNLKIIFGGHPVIFSIGELEIFVVEAKIIELGGLSGVSLCEFVYKGKIVYGEISLHFVKSKLIVSYC